METTLIAGVAHLANDLAVLAAIRSVKAGDGAGKLMYIALLGPNGNIYRTVRTRGFGEYMEVCKALSGLGFDHVPRTIGSVFDDVLQLDLDARAGNPTTEPTGRQGVSVS